MTRLRSHGKLGASVEISCPQPAVGGGSRRTNPHLWVQNWDRLGAGRVGRGHGCCKPLTAGPGRKWTTSPAREAVPGGRWGEGDKGEAVPPWAKCKSTGDWGEASSRKCQRKDSSHLGEGEKRQPQQPMSSGFLSLSVLIFEMELVRLISSSSWERE